MDKNIVSVPDHLGSINSDFIQHIEIDGDEYFTYLPNRNKGFFVKITNDDFGKIMNLWNENKVVLLSFNGGQIINKNYIINSTTSIFEEEDLTSFM